MKNDIKRKIYIFVSKFAMMGMDNLVVLLFWVLWIAFLLFLAHIFGILRT